MKTPDASFWYGVAEIICLTFPEKIVVCRKHCIPEGNRKIPEGYPEGQPEGKKQYAKHRIPEGNRKVPEGYPEAEPEGKVVFFVFFYSFSC